MAQTQTCSQGHTWEADDINPNGDAPLCPECGAAAAPPPTQDYSGDRTPAPGVTVAGPPRSQEAPSIGVPVVPGYEVLGELGRGGMSVAYKARHLKLNRVVALKMLTAGVHAGPDLLQRFRREGESFARLTHPNIVQIHEVGWIESHGPYLVLEYVEGGSLSQKLARQPQPPRQAAALVAVLARAVHFAHERGVLHRDLKPSNVLLTADGTPKVADFGLARFLQDEVSSAPDRPTPTGAVLGTPGYMAPEQAGGVTRAPTAAMDTYALGAILYELLTGRPPFLAEGPMETMLLALTEDPVPPRRLQSKAPRDLETICLHCLRKNPRQRYPSAAALADDLQRFLDGKPIQVRPAGPVERLVKWARRRPTVAALLAVSVVAVLAGLGLAGWYQVQLYQKNAALELALAEKKKEIDTYDELLVAALKSMDEFGDTADDAIGSLPGGEQAQRAILEKRLEFFAPFLSLEPDNPRLQERKARALMEVAKIHRTLGETGKAEEELKEAVRLYEAADGASPTPERRVELARAYVRLGDLLAKRGSYEEAERRLTRGNGLLQEWVDGGKADADARRDLGASFQALALERGLAGRLDSALDAIGRAEAVQQALVADYPAESDYKVLLGEDHAQHAELCRAAGDRTGGLAEADSALRLLAQAGPDGTDRDDRRQSLANLHFVRGDVLGGDGEAARPDFEEAARLWDGLAQEHPAAPLYRRRAAQVRRRIGRLDVLATDYRVLGASAVGLLGARFGEGPLLAVSALVPESTVRMRWEDAEGAFQEADRLYLSLPAEQRADPTWRAERRENRSDWAGALRLLGRYGEAEKIDRDLIAESPQDPAPHVGLAETLNAQGRIDLERGRVLESTPAVGLTVTANPLGAGQAYVGQYQSGQAELRTAERLFREVLDDLDPAARRFSEPENPVLRRDLLDQRYMAADGLAQAAMLLFDRDQLSRAVEAKAAIAETPLFASITDDVAVFLSASREAGLCAFYAYSDPILSEEQRMAAVQAHTRRSVQLLRRAVDRGYHDLAALRQAPGVRELLNDSSSYLQGPRQDLQNLLDELQKNTHP